MFKLRKGTGLPLAFAAALALCASGAFADEASQSSSQSSTSSYYATSQSKTATTGFSLARGSELIGLEVQGASGEKLGTVDDIVLDSQHEGIEYVAMKHGGMAGMGGKTIAVPWSEFRAASAQPGAASDSATAAMPMKPDHFILNASKASLDALKGIDANNWPQQIGSDWQQNQGAASAVNSAIDQAKGEMTAGTPSVDGRRLSMLLGSQVIATGATASMNSSQTEKSASEKQSMSSSASKSESSNSSSSSETSTTANQQNLGKIKDAVVNLQNGRLAFAFVSLAQPSDQQRAVSAVPWSSLQFEAQEPKTVALDANATTLGNYAFQSGEETDQLARLSQSSYSRQIYEAYQQGPQWDALGYVGADQPNSDATQNGNQIDHYKEKSESSHSSYEQKSSSTEKGQTSTGDERQNDRAGDSHTPSQGSAQGEAGGNTSSSGSTTGGARVD